jgi:hypothetical protein
MLRAQTRSAPDTPIGLNGSKLKLFKKVRGAVMRFANRPTCPMRPNFASWSFS